MIGSARVIALVLVLRYSWKPLYSDVTQSHFITFLNRTAWISCYITTSLGEPAINAQRISPLFHMCRCRGALVYANLVVLDSNVRWNRIITKDLSKNRWIDIFTVKSAILKMWTSMSNNFHKTEFLHYLWIINWIWNGYLIFHTFVFKVSRRERALRLWLRIGQNFKCHLRNDAFFDW